MLARAFEISLSASRGFPRRSRSSPWHSSRRIIPAIIRNPANVPRLTDHHAKIAAFPRKRARDSHVSRSRDCSPGIDRRFPGGDFIRGFRRGHVSFSSTCVYLAEGQKEREGQKEPPPSGITTHRRSLYHVRTSTPVRRTRVKPRSSRPRMPIDSVRSFLRLIFPADFLAD